MRKSRIWGLVVAGFLLVAGSILYSQLSWYGRAKIVGFALQEGWPLAWGAERHFMENRTDFISVAELFLRDPRILQIRFPLEQESDVCIERNPDRSCEMRKDNNLRESIQATKLYPIFRTNSGHIFFYANTEIRDEMRFDVAILRTTDTGERNRAHCDSLNDLEDFGACYLPLDGPWHIAYEWMPRFGSGTIVEEAQDFAEDVGRKNAVEDDR